MTADILTFPGVPTFDRRPEDILDLWSERKLDRNAVIARMEAIARHYDADIVVPLPQIDSREAPMVANFLAQGIDGHGMRIASVMPGVMFPPERPDQKTKVEKAATRRQAVYGWWQRNEINLRLRRRARWLVAYSSAPVLIRPNGYCPVWEPRSPLETYPGDTGVYDDMRPPDVIFAYRRSGGWLRRNYPHAHAAINSQRRDIDKVQDNDWVSIVEYEDAEQRTLLATGSGRADTEMFKEAEYGTARIINLGVGSEINWLATLESVPNLAGVCRAVVPGRITLGRPKGQFDDSIGLFQMMSKLQALEVNAVAAAVFPDTWFVHDGQGQIVSQADGVQGKIGEVSQGKIEAIQLQPGFQTNQTIDRLERFMRLDNAMPAEMGGESGTNIRTDRRGQSILSAAIDFHIQEHQDILARSMEHEVEVAAEVEKAYFGKARTSFYVSMPKAHGQLDYVPENLWAGDINPRVEYAVAGSDVNSLMVVIGQQVGIGLSSKATAMRQLPNITDPEAEERQIVVEGLRAASLSGIQQQAAAGAIPLHDIARIESLVLEGKTLAEAVEQAQKEAQERQASAGPPGAPDGPVPPGSPEAQPGLAAPGMGAEQPTEAPDAIAPPPASLANLRNTLSAIGRSRQTERLA